MLMIWSGPYSAPINSRAGRTAPTQTIPSTLARSRSAARTRTAAHIRSAARRNPGHNSAGQSVEHRCARGSRRHARFLALRLRGRHRTRRGPERGAPLRAAVRNVDGRGFLLCGFGGGTGRGTSRNEQRGRGQPERMRWKKFSTRGRGIQPSCRHRKCARIGP